MSVAERLRREFLQYFADRSHKELPSASIIPPIPGLMFTNAGMNPFTSIFTGNLEPTHKRIVTAQKCLRVGGKHNDLEQVGKTTSHLTFFEMLGNFSFGDYFREEAIEFAWQVSTEVFGFPAEKLIATFHPEDLESAQIWRKYIPTSRIIADRENFWSMGTTGPCGHCSELLFDLGDDQKGLEFWNIVFMDSFRSDSGQHPLPRRCVDTGVGLERVTALASEVDSVFETDLFRPLLEALAERFVEDRQLVVIADHLRALTIALAEGIEPSNLERGYVLRKLIRRASHIGHRLGVEKPFLGDFVPLVVASLPYYPELGDSAERIAATLRIEEELFADTLHRGNRLLSKAFDKGKKKLSGEEIFVLNDTHGIPLEQIASQGKERGLELEMATYWRLRTAARVRSQLARSEESISDLAPSEFIGYEQLTSTSRVVALFQGGKSVDALDGKGIVVLDRTPFYPTGGGQLGDKGKIGEFVVDSTTSSGAILHHGRGKCSLGEVVLAEVDRETRQRRSAHHTATHLLHATLHKTYGEHIQQAGSSIDEDRFRFDFTHRIPLMAEEIEKIEQEINALLRRDLPVITYWLSYEEAIARREIHKLAGEGYASRVRVIGIGDWHMLCGGTHVQRLSELGIFRIFRQRGIAAGIRRLEGGVAFAAERWIVNREKIGKRAAAILGVELNALPERVDKLLLEHRQQQQMMARYEQREYQRLLEKLSIVDDYTNVMVEGELEPMVSLLQSKYPQVSFSLANAKGSLLVSLTPEVVARGGDARQLIKVAVELLGGSGGGRQERAQARGCAVEKLSQAFANLQTIFKSWMD